MTAVSTGQPVASRAIIDDDRRFDRFTGRISRHHRR